MEIKIRNVDPIALKKIDEMAKKKSISRQEYLKSVIEKTAYDPETNEQIKHLELIIEKNAYVMEEATKSISRLENLLVELLEE
ncbi:hypothetical protein [Fictibacillus enclensis]|uniref:hypothetical protein n=1 Tax=Fictibacillus enclensis TaxID=1017270 RepID=UPI0024C0DD8A|nr:hypothetical protein [Fictibacillus enclensis]WHY71263.1 hypothetical protein QNH15_19955 [Fictibacillus enclensis]